MARRRYGYGFDAFPTRVPVGVQRARATIAQAKLGKEGRGIPPVTTRGRKVAQTFWGNAWCKNLEAYSDFANRLPRGRSYVRQGAVIDLEIEPQKIRALVQGSSLYKVNIGIQGITSARWRAIVGACAGTIDSVVELLRGALSDQVMGVVTRHGEGLFPAPGEIELECSCPDWASMCKHIAAVLYGVGVRLDSDPSLLFRLRGVDPIELTSEGGVTAALADPSQLRSERRLESDDLSALFGIEIDAEPEIEKVRTPATKRAPVKKRAPAKKRMRGGRR